MKRIAARKRPDGRIADPPAARRRGIDGPALSAGLRKTTRMPAQENDSQCR